MRALKAGSPRAVEFVGVGGHHMAEQGLATLFPIDDLAIVGFNAVVLLRIPGMNEAVFVTVRKLHKAIHFSDRKEPGLRPTTRFAL